MTNAMRNPSADFGPELSKAADVAGSVADKTSRLARDLKDQGVEALGHAKEAVTGALGNAANEAANRVDSARQTIADGGDRIAERLRDVSDEQGDGVQARVLDSVASGLTSMSDFLRSADVSQMASGVQRFAQRNPALFAAGAAIAGLVVARAISGSVASRSQAQSSRAQSMTGRGGSDFADRFYADKDATPSSTTGRI